MGNTSRAARHVFDAVATVNAGITSEEVYVAHSEKVCLMLKNSGENTINFKVQVSGNTQRTGGINSLATDWYDYYQTNSSVVPTLLTIPVAAGAEIALDLAPFSFNCIRLIATPAVPDSQGTAGAIVLYGK